MEKLLAHIAKRLDAGHVVRVLGRGGSVPTLTAIASAAAQDTATCPLRTSQLLLVLLEGDDDQGAIHPAIRLVNKKEAVAANAWDVLVLATDVELTTVALSASATKTAVEPAAEIDGAVDNVS